MSEPVNPLVCICVPTYNAEKTIIETLRSICGQSYTNLIVQVVDNASTDCTVAAVTAFADSRITIHRSEVNIGAEANFTRCIQLGKGEYTAIYHADDIYEPDMVQHQVVFLERHPKAGVVFTEARLIDQDGRTIGAIGTPASLPESTDSLYGFEEVFKSVIENSNFFICPSVMARTPVYQNDVRIWRGELFGSGADLDVWLRIARQHALGIIRKPLMRYRIGRSQGSAKVRMSTDRGAIFAILDRYLQEPEVSAMMTDRDRENYARLERRDRIGRAVNLFISGEIEKARGLCNDVWSGDALRAALRTRRGLLVLTWGSYLRFLTFFECYKIGKMSLMYLKRVTHK